MTFKPNHFGVYCVRRGSTVIRLGPTRCVGSVPKLLCLFLCLFTGFATPSLAAPPGSGASKALDSATDLTRFIIALPAPATFQVQTLTNPNRVIVEMDTAEFLLPPLPKDGPVGLIEHFRGGKAGERQSRVVIDVTAPVVIDRSEIVALAAGGGHQLEIDIAEAQTLTPSFEEAAAKRAAFDAKYSETGRMALGVGPALAAPPLPRPAESPAVREQRTYKPIIVIDPGHGGHDSGAKKNGVVEKNVVLAFSHILREQLEKTGRYRVRMTRSDDTFVSLDGRRDFAEQAGAELFIDVHADYAKSNASGATVYSLRQSVAERLKKSTKRSQDFGDLSKKTSGDQGAVRSILGDLFKREIERTDARTDVVSRSLVEFMGNSTTLRPNPHKEAAFRVLKTAHFPSVLVELAYVTNRADAAKLKSREWRESVAASMVEAIDRYFSTQIARLPL